MSNDNVMFELEEDCYEIISRGSNRISKRLCYEDMEQYAEQWEKEFLQWVKKKYAKKVYVMTIKDEDEIFEIADSYIDAVQQNSVKEYWKTF